MSTCFPWLDTDKLWQGPYSLLLKTTMSYTYVRFEGKLQEEGF